jgi:hypothetical protein
MTSVTTDAIREILERGTDADEALRDVVDALATDDRLTWAGIAFLEDDAVVLGPSAGEPDERRRTVVPLAYDGAVVGELLADGAIDQDVLEQIAVLVAPYALIGWDTRGETWDP